MKRISPCLVVLCILWTPGKLKAQNNLDDIDLFRIHQKKIRAFIDRQKQDSIHRFTDVQATLKPGDDVSLFSQVRKTFLIKDNLSHVWNMYHQISPAKSWNGGMVSFGVLFSKRTNNVSYCDDLINGIDTGQVMYVNLKILKGVYNLAVAFEITSIDEVNKTITFSYIKGGKSQGEQILKFENTAEGYTEIIHETLFRSDSRFRDRYLYPFFHNKAISDFHRNMLSELKSEEQIQFSLSGT